MMNIIPFVHHVTQIANSAVVVVLFVVASVIAGWFAVVLFTRVRRLTKE